MTDRTALVTGATSGFGAALARRFVGEGWRVVGVGRRAERLEALRDELGDALHTAAFDIRDEAAFDAMLDGLPEPFRGLDLLINNAGLARGLQAAQEAKLDDWKAMISTNVEALVAVPRKVSSVAGSYPYRFGNVYAGSKAFVTQFSLALRADLHGTGVRVTSIEPGMAQTEFTVVRTGGDQAASDALYKGVNPMTAQDIADTIFWVATLPPHLNVNRLEIMPVNQDFAGFAVAREG